MSCTLITTGGTIGYWSRDDRMLSGRELSQRVGVVFDEVKDLYARPSWDLTLHDMLAVASCVRSVIDDGHQSIVVTHGTDTMEETAWLTDLLLGERRRATSRVIFTGAMRFADAPDFDGSDNLALASSHALDSSLAHQGVQIAFAGRLHAARWARKIDAVALDAFSSDERPSSSGPLPPTTHAIDDAVATVTANALVRQPIPGDVRGVVLDGTGAGHVPSSYNQKIERLWLRGVPVVIASRARDVVRRFERDDRVLRAGELTAHKATLALMTALGVSTRLDDVCEWWTELLSSSVR